MWGTRGGVKFRQISVSNNTSSCDNAVQLAPAEHHPKAKRVSKLIMLADDGDSSSSEEDPGQRLLARRKKAIQHAAQHVDEGAVQHADEGAIQHADEGAIQHAVQPADHRPKVKGVSMLNLSERR